MRARVDRETKKRLCEDLAGSILSRTPDREIPLRPRLQREVLRPYCGRTELVRLDVRQCQSQSNQQNSDPSACARTIVDGSPRVWDRMRMTDAGLRGHLPIPTRVSNQLALNAADAAK